MEKNMTFTESAIQKHLRRLFCNNKYALDNAFVFARDWECDHFSVSTSGYCYEVEIKVSVSDYKADFKKYKHEIFGCEKNIVVQKWSTGEDHNNPYWEIRATYDGIKEHYPEYYTRSDEGYYRFITWERKERITSRKLYCPEISSIRYIEKDKKALPNVFYYAVPEGMITVSDLPKYAGLIYCDEHKAWIVKRAPFIHKEFVLPKLYKVLLDKFYWMDVDRRQLQYHETWD